jgi:DNA uptake protein ComE-like DNA-binding protein
MKKVAIVGAGLIVMMAAGGCMVSKDQYQQAVREAEVAKANLEDVQTRKTVLEQEVKKLREQSAKLAERTQAAEDELQRLRDSREKERSSVEGRVKELEQKIRDMTAQYKAMQQKHEELKEQNETLKATVARYQKELKERERAVQAARPPSPPAPPAAGTSLTPAGRPMGEPAPVPPSVAPVPTAPKTGLTPVNVNTASANDMVLFLGLTKEMAEKVVTNRPYRLKGELVAKNVLPKTTFDVIKDRITVSP